VVNDLNDRVCPRNADVEYRHDVAILGSDVVVAEPCEIEYVEHLAVSDHGKRLPRRVDRPTPILKLFLSRLDELVEPSRKH
jgi:hypothetical protein